jgi:hypothetical protein
LTVTLTESTKLKTEVNDRFSAQIHFHDGCGGQYFSLDESMMTCKSKLLLFYPI